MCMQLAEVYAVCRCMYHLHAVDACSQYGLKGHSVVQRVVLVGYSCPEHQSPNPVSQSSKTKSSDVPPRDRQINAIYKDNRPVSSTKNAASLSFSSSSAPILPKPQSPNPVSRNSQPNPKDTPPRDGQKPSSKENNSGFSADETAKPNTINSASTSLKPASGNLEPESKDGLPRDGQSIYSEDKDSVFSADDAASLSSFTSIAVNDALDEILQFLRFDHVLKYLWPYVISYCADREGRAEAVIKTFLNRYGQDLRIDAKETLETMASKFIRRRSSYLANRIYSSVIDDRERGHSKLWHPSSTRNEPSLPILLEDSDPEDVDQSTVERFEAVRDFLSKGRAFNHLQQRLEIYVQMAVMAPQNAYDRFAIASQNFIGRLSRKHPKPGQTRLTWTCVCGRELFDDYAIENADTLKQIEATLPKSQPSSNEQRHSPKQIIISAFAGAGAQIRGSVRGLFSQLSVPQLPQHSSSKNQIIGKCPSTSDTLAIHDYLLLCIPFMQWATKLSQAEVCQVGSDHDYFRLLRWYYDSKRGRFLSSLQLRKVNALHFAQFELYRDDFVDVSAIPSVPPRVRRTEYSYSPPPSDTVPPIGPNLLLHFFEHPDHASVRPSLFNKIPKRKRSKLEPCPVKGSSVGWGILIVEGFHWNMFFLYSIIGFVLCTTFGTVWAILKKDVQGGFGIGACLLAFGIFCGGFVHTRSTSMYLPQAQ